LSKNNEGEASGGGSDVPTLVTPALDTTAVDSSMQSLSDKIKAYFGTFDFSNLINAFGRVRDAAMPIVDNIGQGLKWFFDNVLTPLAQWTISDLLPAFLDVLAGVLKVINPLLESFGRVAKLLWDNFLQPIASWTGGVIVSVLEELADVLSTIGDWMSDNQGAVDAMTYAVIGFFAAWTVGKLMNFVSSCGGVVGALQYIALALGETTIAQGAQAIASGVATVATTAWTGICGIASIATTALGAAFTFLTNPITLIVLAIAAVIAIVVLLVKNWDWVKEKCGEVWDWIKDKFQAFSDWIGSVFATDWTKHFGAFGNVINAFLGVIQTKIDAVKRIFGGVIDFVKGVFTGNWSQAWDGIKNVFGGIWDYISAAPKAALNLVIKSINWAIGKINKALTFSVPDWDFLPDGIQGKTFGINIPEIPQLAKGGVLDQPTLAMVAEAGKEAVVPLENNTEWVDKVGSMVGTAVLQAMNFSNGNSNNNSGGEAKIILDGQVCGRLLNPYIKSEEKRIGSSAITTV
jgi:phage-related protein